MESGGKSVTEQLSGLSDTSAERLRIWAYFEGESRPNRFVAKFVNVEDLEAAIELAAMVYPDIDRAVQICAEWQAKRSTDPADSAY